MKFKDYINENATTIKVKCNDSDNSLSKMIYKIVSDARNKDVNIILDKGTKDYEQTFTISQANLSYPSFTKEIILDKKLQDFIEGIKKIGNIGHSFSVEINGERFGWDGDGSDSIFSIEDSK